MFLDCICFLTCHCTKFMFLRILCSQTINFFDYYITVYIYFLLKPFIRFYRIV